MAVFESITVAGIHDQAVNRLTALRAALAACSDLNAWLAGLAIADLQAIGFSAADAQTLKTALADANELAVLYNGGGLGTYTLPYNFSASQRAIMGPS
jgi:hypothetical protein